MHRTTFHNRKAFQIENDLTRVTVTEESGHIAEILNKKTGVSPLWIPPWKSIEPSEWSEQKYPEYGTGPEAHLLSAIMGHNLCLYLFGGPSPAEEAAGVRIHGEAGVVRWKFELTPSGLIARCVLPLSHLTFERAISLDGHKVEFRETVENLEAFDVPIAWTQHVTLGPPFLDRGKTEFHANGGFVGSLPGGNIRTPARFSTRSAPRSRRPSPGAPARADSDRSLWIKPKLNSFFIAWSPAVETAVADRWKRRVSLDWSVGRE